MSGSTNGTMKCLGCNKDKPRSDFGTTGMAKGLCKSCRSGRVSSTGKGKRSGSWLDGVGDAIGDFIEAILP